jgi:hypothetical protein
MFLLAPRGKDFSRKLSEVTSEFTITIITESKFVKLTQGGHKIEQSRKQRNTQKQERNEEGRKKRKKGRNEETQPKGKE